MGAVVRRNRRWMREEREKPEREGKEMNRWSVKIARPFWSVGSVLHVSRAASPPAVDAIWDGGWESAARPCKNTADRYQVITFPYCFRISPFYVISRLYGSLRKRTQPNKQPGAQPKKIKANTILLPQSLSSPLPKVFCGIPLEDLKLIFVIFSSSKGGLI